MSSDTGSLTAATRAPRELALLRLRGARGGVIAKHRSMIGLRWTPGRVARAVVLSLAGFAVVFAALPTIGRLWGRFFEWGLPLLGVPAGLGWHRIPVGSLFTIAVPYPTLEGPWPGIRHWIVVGGLTTAVIIASLLFPMKWLPARYFFRFVAAIQTVSIAYFAFSSPPFPYPLPGYIGGFLAAGMAVVALVPIALGFGFYIFDHTLARQLLLTVMIVGHLTILLPLQGLAHAYLINRFSLLVQPTLFFVFGLLVEVLVLVAFYSWAMSWPGTEIPQTTPGMAETGETR